MIISKEVSKFVLLTMSTGKGNPAESEVQLLEVKQKRQLDMLHNACVHNYPLYEANNKQQQTRTQYLNLLNDKCHTKCDTKCV